MLRPISEALAISDVEAISPGLDQLRDVFERSLPLAEREADDRLDTILSEGTQQLVSKVAHNLGNREVGSEAELGRALGELRERVLVELAAGHRVRLV